jgi:hypothetical protein
MPLSQSIRSLADLTAPTRDAVDRLERDWFRDSPPDVVAAGTIGRSFAFALTALNTSDIAAVGKSVEMLLTTGEEDIKDAVATGFLESLLAEASRRAISLRGISWMLGPESTRYCRAWDEFTGTKTDGLWDTTGRRGPDE